MEILTKFKELLLSEMTIDTKYQMLITKDDVIQLLTHRNDNHNFYKLYEDFICSNYGIDEYKKLVKFFDYLIDKFKFIEQVRKDIIWESYRPAGGQHAGVDSSVMLVADNIGVRLHVVQYRQQLKNRTLALKLFEVALEEYCETHFKYE